MQTCKWPNGLVVFSHGKESGPYGKKINALSFVAEELGYHVLSVDYEGLTDPDQRVEHLLSISLPPHDHLILVGSSMGVYVSTIAAERLEPSGLFLLAPAFYLPGYRCQDPSPGSAKTAVVTGWKDNIVPVKNGIRFAEKFGANLHVFDADHRLNTVIPELCGLFRGLERKPKEKGLSLWESPFCIWRGWQDSNPLPLGS
jgi:pimeloyl-ACP methyl ester carboxylesterase